MKNLAVGALIGLGALWSCGGGLGFDQPDEEALADVWTEHIYDGDIAGELELQTDNIYIIRDDEPLVEQERGTYELTPGGDGETDYPILDFTPTGAASYRRFIKFYDPTTLDLSGDATTPYDPDFPSYYR